MKRKVIVLLALGSLAIMMTGCSDRRSESSENDVTSASSRVAGLFDECELARIYFRLAEVENVPSEAELREILTEGKEKLAVGGEYKRLASDASIIEKPLYRRVATNDLVLVSVNGHDLLRSAANDYIQLKCELAFLANPHIRKEDLVRIVKSVRKSIVGAFVNMEVFGQYADANGYVYDESRIETEGEKIAKNCHLERYDEVLKRLNKREREALVLALKRKDRAAYGERLIRSRIDPKSLLVTDEDVRLALKKCERIRINSIATNKLVYAHASNVWNRIQSHELTFNEAFTDYNEDESAEDEGRWGACKPAELKGEPELAEKLLQASSGTVLPPLQSDGGLCIYKVLSIRQAKANHVK